MAPSAAGGGAGRASRRGAWAVGGGRYLRDLTQLAFAAASVCRCRGRRSAPLLTVALQYSMSRFFPLFTDLIAFYWTYVMCLASCEEG